LQADRVLIGWAEKVRNLIVNIKHSDRGCGNRPHITEEVG
jgi:hypothetical protein